MLHKYYSKREQIKILFFENLKKKVEQLSILTPLPKCISFFSFLTLLKLFIINNKVNTRKGF